MSFSHFNLEQHETRIQNNSKESQEFERIVWDYINVPPRKIKRRLVISLQNQNEIKYTQDGTILRIDQIKTKQKECEVLTNMDQIKYLFWLGEYGKNNEKIDKWIATWKGETLVDVGGYYSKDINWIIKTIIL